ncbi:hypothetical protein [Magnetofaba australis]|uniref:MamF n=1 Tax=Magnetofaba australis IT-1 TaxID=1434232 RepID=W0LN58_9PROT|nr:hypothetical protein [Magnetofaba australis]AHG23887.1 MamF [Magnetofaba australis IT-1]OSM08634.1 putative Magnetosome protein MamF [Magnetofaba australis IT-1]
MHSPEIEQASDPLAAHASPTLKLQLHAALSYLGILVLVPFLTGRNEPFVQFHARQGIIIWIWEVLAVYALIVPGIGKLIFQFSSVLCFVLSVYGLGSVILGRYSPIPGISRIVRYL